MKDSRFLELLKSLNQIELERLKFFVESKLFNTNKKIILLYNIILSFPENRSINELILFEQLNKEHIVSKANFRMLLTDFSNLLENFLVHDKLRNNELTQLELLLRHSFDNNMHYLLEKTITCLQSYFEGRNDLSLNEKRVKLEYLLINFQITGQKKIELSDVLLSYVFGQYLHILNLNSLKDEAKIKKLVYDEITKNISKVKSKDIFSYFHFLVEQNKSDTPLDLQVFEKLFKLTDSDELRCLISEFMLKNSNLNANKSLKYANWIWENGSKRVKLLNADKILITFIQNYEMQLSKDVVKFIKENNKTNNGYFSIGLYYFYLNDFSGCLVELEHLNPSDKDEEAQIRQLKMCCFVRLNHLKQFRNGYGAFKKFVSVNKTTEILEDTVKFCRLLFLIINNKDNLDKLLTVESEVMATAVLNKKWLIDELSFHFKNLTHA